MKIDPRGWAELIRSLGEALLEVFRAELGALEGDLKGSAKLLGRALLLAALAAAILFWTLGAMTLAAIELMALWLPRWGATLAVTGILLLIVVGIAAWAESTFRRIEPPGDTVRRRWDEHQVWWRVNVLSAGPSDLEDGPAPLDPETKE